jgi:hypothetical protein
MDYANQTAIKEDTFIHQLSRLYGFRPPSSIRRRFGVLGLMNSGFCSVKASGRLHLVLSSYGVGKIVSSSGRQLL